VSSDYQGVLPECPAPLAQVLSRLPALPGSMLFAAALNAGLASQLPADVRALLLRRKLCLRVSDARLRFDFTWTGQRFAALGRQAESDLIISACGPDLVRLATRKEDPDSLFFNRRLSLEGDTELGLVVKNTLDALELPVLNLGRWRAR
jgi:predicted lipid carrier protein YhbT